MKIVCSIEARMKSSRLPGKVLEKVCGKPVLLHIVERVKRSKKIDQIVVATSTSPDDDKIVEFCCNHDISFYRGSEEDVLSRLVMCHRFTRTDVVVEITGDSPFVDPEVIDETIEAFMSSGADYVSNTLTRSHPIGIRSQVFSLSLLEECERETSDKKDREHVTTFICRNKEGRYTLKNVLSKKEHMFPKVRLTLDYPEDLEVTRKIYEKLYPEKNDFSLSDVLNFLSENPEIVKINENCKQVYKEGA
jgi:spore coat polysaccharide biosynthesis protein SpsF